MPHTAPSQVDARTFIKNVHGIRYHVKDVARSVTFYTQHLGFLLEHQQLPAFASVAGAKIQIEGPRRQPDRAV